MSAPRARRVPTLDALSLAVEEVGPSGGPAVVLVHGLALDRTVWRTVFGHPRLRHLRLVSFDVRGHGDSDQPEGDAP